MFTDGKKQFGHQQLASAQNTHTLSQSLVQLQQDPLPLAQLVQIEAELEESWYVPVAPIHTFTWKKHEKSNTHIQVIQCACFLCFQPALISRWNPEEPSMVLVVLNLSRPNPTPSESEEAIINLSNKRPIAKYKDWHYKWYTFFFAPISRNFAPTSRNFAPFSHQAIGSNCCQIRQTACELYDTSYFCNFSSTTWHQQPMVALSSRSKAVMASNQEDGISSCGWFHR